MKNWKTTLTGVIAIVTAVLGAVSNIVNGHPQDWTVTISAVIAGVGLITAKDSNVTGGTVQQ
jgi:hypothetical protein